MTSCLFFVDDARLFYFFFTVRYTAHSIFPMRLLLGE